MQQLINAEDEMNRDIERGLLENPQVMKMNENDRNNLINSMQKNYNDCFIKLNDKTKYTGPENNPFNLQKNQTYTCIELANMNMNM